MNLTEQALLGSFAPRRLAACASAPSLLLIGLVSSCMPLYVPSSSEGALRYRGLIPLFPVTTQGVLLSHTPRLDLQCAPGDL